MQRRATLVRVSLTMDTFTLQRPGTIAMDDPITLTLETRFEDFYRAEYPALVAVAAVLSGSRESGEDLTQDAMVRAWMRWGSVQRLDRPGGWVHRVLINACTSWWRRRRTEARHLARLRAEESVASGPTPDVVAFWSAVRALPERPRMVVALHYAGDRPLNEIAAILSVPEGTVRSDLSRARAALVVTLGLES